MSASCLPNDFSENVIGTRQKKTNAHSPSKFRVQTQQLTEANLSSYVGQLLSLTVHASNPEWAFDCRATFLIAACLEVVAVGATLALHRRTKYIYAQEQQDILREAEEVLVSRNPATGHRLIRQSSQSRRIDRLGR